MTILSKMGVFRSRSFAAERLISGLILAIYAGVSVSSDPRSKGHF
jgi:hypothetical protein